MRSCLFRLFCSYVFDLVSFFLQFLHRKYRNILQFKVMCYFSLIYHQTDQERSKQLSAGDMCTNFYFIDRSILLLSLT